jgi:integrase
LARPQRHTIVIRQIKNRAEPWGTFWFATGMDGTRLRRSKFFLTEEAAQAFKAAREQAAAALPAPPEPLTVPRLRRPRSASALSKAATARPGSLTLREFGDDWLATVVVRRKASTQRSYAELLANHIYPHLGHIRVSPITLGPQQIVGLLAVAARSQVTWGTQKAVLRVVSSCLRWAVKYRHLQTNPCLGLLKDLKDDTNPDYADPEPNPLTAAQEGFLQWLRTGTVPAWVGKPALWFDGPRLRGGQFRTRGYPEWFPYFFTLLRTGMRRGEAAALTWTTVYLDRTPPRARLEKSYSPEAKAAETVPTGDVALKGKRPHDIDLGDELVEVLTAVRQTQREQALKAGRKLSPYVFVSPRGTRIFSDSATAERVFARGMQALGLEHEGHTIHDCRDSFATLHLLQDPGRLFWVSWMLGHRQTSTTLNRYTKWVPSLTTGQQFASALDAPRPGRKSIEEFDARSEAAMPVSGSACESANQSANKGQTGVSANTRNRRK